MRFNPFRPNKYNQPAPLDPPPAPTPEAPRQNDCMVDEKNRIIQLRLYHNDEHSIRDALGSLEMAKDFVKAKLSDWSRRERPSLLVPRNGK